MRKAFCLILSLLLLLNLMGCNANDEEIQTPVSFYYRTAQVDFNAECGLFGIEIREGQPYTEDLQGLLSVYLAGPESEDLKSPFPQNVSICGLTSSDNQVQIILSSEFSQLSGHSLTIACACLSKTIMDCTKCGSVLISAQDSLLDGSESVFMSQENLLLLDRASQETSNE